ncbi:MAG: cyclic nucleotide-binding and patatin-like phospholipase domain-containing protein [Chitinophagales bacterium]
MNIFNLLKDSIKEIPYLSNLTSDNLQKISSKATLINLQCKETLLKQGDEGEEVFILIDGRLRAVRETEGEAPTVLGEISKGEIVGEMAALIGEKRNATIYAIRNSMLLCFKGSDFVELLQQQQSSLKQLIQTVTERTKKSFVPKHTVNTVAIVPITKGLELSTFGKHLVEAIQPFGTPILLSQAVFEAENGGKFNENENYNKELVNYEAKGNFVLYWTDGKWNNWTRHCISRADKVLFIADSLQSPKVASFEKKVVDYLSDSNHAAQELVLIHPTRTKIPTKTRNWLAKRNLQKHYHVAWNEIKDIQRLARFLTGNAIGVALSGGGLRTAAQFGILHAFIEAGIPIDIIGGSSGGAFTGASYAQVFGAEEMLPIVHDSQKLFKSTNSITLPIVSLFSGKKFTDLIKLFYKDVRIEDLWTDYFCVSLSLVSGDLKVHTEGHLWKAVRASTSVMGILPPVLEDGDCLVDGGLINACPSNILVKMGVGKLIVVNACSSSGIEVDGGFSPDVSGWEILLKKINPFFKKQIVPNIGTTIIQSMYMASNHLQKKVYDESKIDLFIELPLDEFTSLDVESVKNLYQIGFDYGRTQVDLWKKELGIPHLDKPTVDSIEQHSFFEKK